MSSGLAVVTGASRGVGKATALALAQRRLDVVLVGRPSANLDSVAEACRAFGGQVYVVQCDLSDPIQVDRAASHTAALGPACTLINNAGVATRARIEDLTLETYAHQMNTNLLAPIWFARALLPSMKRTGKGTIVNVASISSTLGTAGQIVYNASKWALLGFTKSLAAELADSGLMTVAVLPGSVDTDMLVGSGFAPRMTPAEVAKTLVHYALDAPLAHNGATIEMFGV
jgi:3-oxoacyl-[acyl-carrier protein] reductase